MSLGSLLTGTSGGCSDRTLFLDIVTFAGDGDGVVGK